MEILKKAMLVALIGFLLWVLAAPNEIVFKEHGIRVVCVDSSREDRPIGGGELYPPLTWEIGCFDGKQYRSDVFVTEWGTGVLLYKKTMGSNWTHKTHFPYRSPE